MEFVIWSFGTHVCWFIHLIFATKICEQPFPTHAFNNSISCNNSEPVHRTATYKCDDTKCCIVQWSKRGKVSQNTTNLLVVFWLTLPFYFMVTYKMGMSQLKLYNTILTSSWWVQQCSKHVEEYNKLIIKQEFVL